MWQLVQANVGQDAGRTGPVTRSKHAVCFASDGHIYLFGGKSKHSSLKDLWRFDSEQNYWEEIKCEGDCPPCLQNHSMNAWNDKLYVFGGEVGYDSNDTPMWQLDLNVCQWIKWQSVPIQSPGISGQQPSGRSGHSSVLYDNKLCIFGGHQALNGTLNDLWTFDLETEKWLCLSAGSSNSVQPASRYLHSAVVYQKCMYIYGGMNNLQPKSDFWKWDFDKSKWIKIKCGKGPGELSGHSAIRVHDNMFMFGGERVGHFLNELWRFNFVSESWTKIQADGLLPTTNGPCVAIANPLFELLEFHERQMASELTESESNESKLFELASSSCDSDHQGQMSKGEKSHKKDKCKLFRSKENHKESRCNCKSKPTNVFRRLFRKRLLRSKNNSSTLTLNSSSSSISCRTCHKHKTEIESSDQDKCESYTSDCAQCKTQQSMCSKCLQSSQDTLKLTYSNKQPMVQIEPEVKYEMGQINDELEDSTPNGRVSNTSTDTSEDELILRLSVLQKQLKDDLPSSTLNANEPNKSPPARFDVSTKPRPKSELIAELISLEEDINDSWDGIDLKRHSVHESMSYYSLCFPSPNYTPTNKSNAITSLKNTFESSQDSATLRPTTNRTVGIRPKSYQPDSRTFDYTSLKQSPTQSNESGEQSNKLSTGNNQTNSIIASNQSDQSQTINAINHKTTQDTIYSPTSASFTMESISHSMSQSSGYQSLLDESESLALTNQSNSINSHSLHHTSNLSPPYSSTSNHAQSNLVATSLASTNSIYANNLIEVQHRRNDSNRRLPVRTSQRYSRDMSGFDVSAMYAGESSAGIRDSWPCDSLEQLDTTSSICSSNTTNNCTSFSSYTSNRLPNSMSGGLELTLDSAAQQRMFQRTRQLPRAFSFDKKLCSNVRGYSNTLHSATGQGPLWTRFHAIKEVIVPTSPAIRKKTTKGAYLQSKFVRRRFNRFSIGNSKEELQLAMYVFGGQTTTNQGQPMCVWKLYI